MSSDLLVVTGTLTVDEAPAEVNGVATVKLVDAEGEVLAGTAFGVEQLPASYELAVDPQVVAAPDRLFVWAALRDGSDWWGTLDLAPASDSEIVLARVPS